MKTDKPILELMDDFLANQDVSETTRKKYRENLHYFISWITRNCEDVKNPKRSELIRYKEHLIQSRKAATTIDTYMVPVRKFFRWLEDEKIYDDIAAGIHSPKRYHGNRKEYLRSDKVNELLKSISKASITGKRDYAIISLMVNTGMRCIEISRMDLCDVTPSKAGFVVMIQGKGHIAKDRSITIPESLMFPIHNYLIERTDLDGHNNPPMFVNHSNVSKGKRFTQLSISKIIKKYLRNISIDDKKITAHSLRHTAAINAIKAGATIVQVQSMLGHKNSMTTDIYLRALEAETAEEGTAIRLLGDYYKGAQRNKKSGQNGPGPQCLGNL
jgi:integrase/recombinase XerC/integrase/recombinase XerD